MAYYSLLLIANNKWKSHRFQSSTYIDYLDLVRIYIYQKYFYILYVHYIFTLYLINNEDALCDKIEIN